MKTAPFEAYASIYDNWFDENKSVYESEVLAVRQMMPESGFGLEIGAGSGRFGVPLGVSLGLEPCSSMYGLAIERGMRIVAGIGERLPFADEAFDYCLMVTTDCFLDDTVMAIREAHRVLKPGGAFINAIIDKESALGRLYQAHKDEDPFYRVANFYSVEEIVGMMWQAGFSGFDFCQTVSGMAQVGDAIEEPVAGYGEGAFVVVKGRKII